MTPGLMNERVLVQKQGKSTETYLAAIFSRNNFIVEDAGIQIDTGDIIIRVKDDFVERYTVVLSEHRNMDELPVYHLIVEALSELQSEIDYYIS